jgi:hypothetical protein
MRTAHGAGCVAPGFTRKALVFPDVVRMLAVQSCRERLQLAFGRLRVHAWRQPSPHSHADAFYREVRQQPAARDEVRLLDHRQPDVRVVQTETAELDRGNASHGGRLAVQVNRPANDGRIRAEMTLPERVTQHDGRCGVRDFVQVRIEQASELWHRAELAEEVRGHEVRLEWCPVVICREPRRVPAHDGRERLRVLAEECHFRIRQHGRIAAWSEPLESQQRVRVPNGQWPQDDQVEEAKGRDVDADANRQDEDCRDREAWRPAQHPGRVAKVSRQEFHEWDRLIVV